MPLIDADLPERYRALLFSSNDAVVAMDHTGAVIEWNPAAVRTFGWTAWEAAGRDMGELIVPPSLRDRHRAGLARYLGGGEPVVLDRRVEITAMRRDGTEFPCELTITRIAQPGDPVFVGYLRDITERHTAEAELHASRARIVSAADEARRRLERDLHDGAQQHLVGLALTLRLARRKLETDPAFVGELLDEALGDLATATAELRELARGLHPAVLTEGGLKPALVSLAKRAGVPVTIDGLARGAAGPDGRDHRLLRGRRGADERRPLRRGHPDRRQRAARRRCPARRGARRRPRRRDHGRRQRPARPARPGRRDRRHALRRKP